MARMVYGQHILHFLGVLADAPLRFDLAMQFKSQQWLLGVLKSQVKTRNSLGRSLVIAIEGEEV
jgi:hypothetical protein